MNKKDDILIKFFIKSSLVVLGIGLIGMGVGLIQFYMTYRDIEDSLRDQASLAISTPYIIVTIYLLVLGIYLSYHQYSGLISIQAERSKYLKQIVGIGTVGSVLLEVINGIGASLFTMLGRFLCPLAYIQNGFLDTTPQEEMGLNFYEIISSNLIEQIGIGFFIFAVGLLLGSLFYRLKISTAICMISILPILLALSVISEILFSTQASTLFMLVMLMMIKPMTNLGGQLAYSVLFYAIAVGLLVKAPIKAYAHDLL